MKILLCGDINSGKSTLIDKIIKLQGIKPRGYITVRMPENDEGRAFVYLYDIFNPPENIRDAAVIMEISENEIVRRPELMDTLAAGYLENIPEGSWVVLDEIGTLESAAPVFQAAVMRILSGNYNVLASVKAQNTTFLRKVRSHPDCELYIITPENRDALYNQLVDEYNLGSNGNKTAKG